MPANFDPPIVYLMNCSTESLEGYQLAELNRVAKLRREIRTLRDQALEHEANGLLARYLLQNRDRILDIARRPRDQKRLDFRE